MTVLALLLKISVPPVLVALMSLAARRWGATFGGLIMGLPWMTGPVLFFLGLDKGPVFLAAAAKGAVFAVWSIGAFILAFGFAAARFRWPGALAAGVSAFAAIGLLTMGLDMPLEQCGAVAATVLIGAHLMLPRPGRAAIISPPPSWDIAARMAATFALVSVIMISVDLLGPQRSGLLASFPVILTVIGAFTHSQQGQDGLLPMLRGFSLSLLAFTGFFVTVSALATTYGQFVAYAAGAVVALTVSGGLILWSRRAVPKLV
jgi:hypothetical protein